jgi:hypothetical protein
VTAATQSVAAAASALRLEHAADSALVVSPYPRPVRASDIAEGEPVAWAVQDLSTAGDFGIVAGEDGALKSAIVQHLSGAVAGGYRAFGRFKAVQGPVLFISEEDPAPVIRNRIEAMCRGHGWDLHTVLDNVHVLAMAEVRLMSLGWKTHLLGLIESLDIKLVVLDPWGEFGTGEENSNTDGRNLVQVVRTLLKPTGANVIAVAHYGKPAEGKRPRDRIRGNTAFSSASRFTYAVEHDEAARELRITCLKLSRGAKLPPFVVRYVIEHAADNRAVWTVARFDYASVLEATLDRAEAFVVDQLGAGDRMNTTDLKAAAKGTGVSGQDISRAIKSLEMRRKIDFEQGAKGSKLWALSCLPGDSRQPEQQTIQLAGQPECLPGNQPEDEFCLPSPFRGKQQPASTAGRNGCAPLTERA